MTAASDRVGSVLLTGETPMSNQPEYSCSHPWIGKNYRDKPYLGKRILIVINSSVGFKRHYTTITTDPMRTIRNVEFGTYDSLLPPIKGVYRDSWSKAQRRMLRDGVALYDYNQSNYSRLTVEESLAVQSMFKESFQKILGQLRPQVIAMRGPLFEDDAIFDGGSLPERIEFLLPSELRKSWTLKRVQYLNTSAMAFTIGGPVYRHVWIGMLRLAVRRLS
jgi:hypothetical protein